MIKLEFIYWLMGVMLVGVTIMNARDNTNPKRWRNVGFWGIYAATFLIGSYVSDFVSGLMVIAMVLVASRGLGQGTRESTTREERVASAAKWKNKLFLPVLIIPFGTLLGTLTLKSATLGGQPLVETGQVTLISLGVATLIALTVGMLMLRPPLIAPIQEARRLMDSVGWAAVLPQSLAALGAVFAAAGVGTVISQLANDYLPLGSAFAVVVAYSLGMAIFTMIMGNAFAAFPVMTAGIGLPLIVGQFG